MNRRLKRAGWIILAWCLLSCVCCGALAQQDAAVKAVAGYDGAVILGRWYPLQIEITAGDESIDGRLYTDVSVNYEFMDRYELPVSIPAGETRTYRMTLRAATAQRTLQICLNAHGTEISESVTLNRMIDSEALAIGVLGGDETMIQALSGIERRDIHGQREIVYAVALDKALLMGDEREMNAFDVLIMDGVEADSLEPDLRKRLDAYEKNGGMVFGQEALAEAALLAQGNVRLYAERIMDEMEAAQERNGDIRMPTGNTRYGMSLNEALRVEGGERLWAIAALLMAYVLLGGGGLYLYMKRIDRSKSLWFALPLLAAAATGLVVFGGYAAGQYQPMHTSVHITHYDEENQLYTEELVSLTAAGRADIHVRTENNLSVNRRQTGYFNTAGDEGKRALRDTVTLGSEPSLAIHGEAAWLVRSLVIDHDAAPAGEISARAWIEEDGLHAAIENGTDTDIANALLLTGLGYAFLGDLPAGGKADAHLKRRDGMRLDESGNPVIEASVMLPFAQSEYSVLRAYIDPECALDPEFARGSLSKKEQMRRNLLQIQYDLASNAWGEGFTAVLIGETPQIPCERLYINGKPAARCAQRSILAKEIRIETAHESGWYYHPSGTFKSVRARIGDRGAPVVTGAFESDYVHNEDGLIIAYPLEGVSGDTVHEIRIETMRYRSVMKDVTLEVYDHAAGRWTDAGKGSYVVISAGLAKRALGEDGVLFIRYRNESEVQVEQLNLPSIIVEGRNTAAQEGSGAA